MRLHYYRFPDSISADIRASKGAEVIENTCSANPERWNSFDKPYIDCPDRDGSDGCRDCSYLKNIEVEDYISGISVTYAKQLLKEFGGAAWTSHIDRDGGVFETTSIELKKNNSQHKYNRHL